MYEIKYLCQDVNQLHIMRFQWFPSPWSGPISRQIVSDKCSSTLADTQITNSCPAVIENLGRSDVSALITVSAKWTRLL